MTRKSRAIGPPTIRCTGSSGILRGPRKDSLKEYPREPSCRTALRQISASGAVYRGPGAPAAGPQHHYTFEVYALDTKLDVPPAATRGRHGGAVFKAMDGHVIGKAVMVGMFKRPQ